MAERPSSTPRIMPITGPARNSESVIVTRPPHFYYPDPECNLARLLTSLPFLETN